MKPEYLQTKREYDVYIQALKDMKEHFDSYFKSQIENYVARKKFEDEE